MEHLYLLYCICLILLHLLAIYISFRNKKFHPTTTFLTTIILVSLPLYVIEHFIFLKIINFALPVTFFLSIYSLKKNYHLLKEPEIRNSIFAFLIGFTYVLIWKFFLPQLEHNTEEITDLYIFSHYFQEGTIPHFDRLLSGELFNTYYDFMFYMLSLLFRVLRTDLRFSFQLSHPICYGVMTMAMYSIGSNFKASSFKKFFSILIILFAGNGIAILGPFIFAQGTDLVWATVRFIGENSNRMFPVINELFNHTPNFQTPHLAVDFPSYLIYLGFLHPPISSYIILLYSLKLYLDLINKHDDKKELLFLITPIVGFLANAWCLPVQGLFVLSYILFHKKLDKSLIQSQTIQLSFLISASLLFLKFSNMGVIDADYGFRIIPKELYAPTFLSILVFYPIIILYLINFTTIKIVSKYKAIFFFIPITFLFTSIFYYKELYSGVDARFTGVSKWWSALNFFSLTIFYFTTTHLNKVKRVVSLLIVISTMSYGLILMKYAYDLPKEFVGKFHQQEHIYPFKDQKHIQAILNSQKKGVILHPIDAGVYTYDPYFIVLSKHNSYLTWPFLQIEYRGNSEKVVERQIFIDYFYRAALEDPLGELLNRKIDIIFWKFHKHIIDNPDFNAEEFRMARNDAKNNVHQKINQYFRWIDINDDLGIWVKKKSQE